MRITKIFCVVSVFFCLSGSAMPQATLQPVKTVLVAGEPGGAVVGPFRCDEKGNVYFRRLDGGDNGPVRSVAPDGTVRANFMVDAATVKLPKLGTDEFVVSPDGAVYVFGWNEQNPYLFSFDKSGQYKSKISLDKNIVVYEVAVFPKGEFLLAGLEPGTKEKPKGNIPITQIVDGDGKFLKNVQFSEDAKFRSLAESGDVTVAREGSGVGNLAVSRGVAVSGADGNAYLMRHASPPIVYVISPAGEVQSTISVSTPDGGGLPMTMQVHGSTLVVQFWNEATKRAVYKLVGLPGGEDIATYEGGKGIGTAFACYNGSQFTFVTPKGGKMYLVEAEPK